MSCGQFPPPLSTPVVACSVLSQNCSHDDPYFLTSALTIVLAIGDWRKSRGFFFDCTSHPDDEAIATRAVLLGLWAFKKRREKNIPISSFQKGDAEPCLLLLTTYSCLALSS
jgi:hypothetical protein